MNRTLFDCGIKKAIETRKGEKFEITSVLQTSVTLAKRPVECEIWKESFAAKKYLDSHVRWTFLDVNVSITDGKIITDFYTKPTNTHQYLLHSSCHATHTKRAIPLSLALRLRRICSTEETFTLRTNELMTYLHKRGYSRCFLRQEITRAKNITRKEALLLKSTTVTTDKSECVPFTLTYNPTLRSISSIIRKHISILTSSHRCHNIFKSAPIVAFRRSNNLTNFLMYELNYATLHRTTRAPRGCFQCGSHCSMCTYIYPTDLLLTHSTPQAKKDPLLTILVATQKTLFR